MDEITVNRSEFPGEGVVAHIDRQRCDGCGLCIEACPGDALSIIANRERPGKRITFVLPKGCRGCGVCQATCPKEAIFIPCLSLSDLRRHISTAIESACA